MAPTATFEDLRAEISGLSSKPNELGKENKPVDWRTALAIGLPSFFGLLAILGVVVWFVRYKQHKVPRNHPGQAALHMYGLQVDDWLKEKKKAKTLEKGTRRWFWPFGSKPNTSTKSTAPKLPIILDSSADAQEAEQTIGNLDIPVAFYHGPHGTKLAPMPGVGTDPLSSLVDALKGKAKKEGG